MRKVALVLAVVFGLGLFAGSSASAEQICNEAGCTGVNQDGYVVVADGKSTNPDPFDGYIGLNNDNGLECAADGGPYNDDGSVNQDHVASPCSAPA